MKTAYRNLGEFIQTLHDAGEIRVISQPVSARLEISRFTDQESKSPGGGKALLFETVHGSEFPVATNLFGSNKRVCLALGVQDLDELADRIRKMITLQPPKGLKDMIGLLPTALQATHIFPRKYRGKTAPCQEVVHTGDSVDVTRLPVLHCWPQDGGPFVTLPLVFTKSLVNGIRNVGMYRMQIYDARTTGMHWHIHKDGSSNYSEYKKAGKRMPVAVAIGADPATIYAATAPLPRHADELLLAGFIRNKPVQLTRCLTVDLDVPAEAEFILEGYVDPDELRWEGPFGDHTGYYSLPDDYPVFHITAITHRRNPVYSATLVGRPPMEDCYLAKATERLFLPLLQTLFPEVADYWLPWEGVFHNIVVVAINKAYPLHAHKVMSGLWGQGQMSFCKAIVVVDGDIDPKNPGQVMHQILNLLDLSSDIVITRGVLDVLDHSSPTPNFGHKIGLDLTRRISGEIPRKTPSFLTMAGLWDTDGLSTVCRELDGVVAWRLIPEAASDSAERRILLLTVRKPGDRSGKSYADQILNHDRLASIDLFLLYDQDIDLNDDSLVLWKLFNNTDPGRDLHIHNNRCVIDACKKDASDGHFRDWPDELTFERVRDEDGNKGDDAMQHDMIAVINAIEEKFRGILSAESRNYLEVDIGKEAERLGYVEFREKYHGVSAIVPIKEAVDGMKVMIDGRTFVNYVQFDSGIALPEHVVRESGLSGKPYIANDSMMLNFV
jgi:4-hydroxy-3-polyprenylbenzoate decarboxylase